MYDKPLLQFEMQQGFFVVQYRKGLSGKRLIREKAYQGQKPGHQKNAGQQGACFTGIYLLWIYYL